MLHATVVSENTSRRNSSVPVDSIYTLAWRLPGSWKRFDEVIRCICSSLTHPGQSCPTVTCTTRRHYVTLASHLICTRFQALGIAISRSHGKKNQFGNHPHMYGLGGGQGIGKQGPDAGIRKGKGKNTPRPVRDRTPPSEDNLHDLPIYKPAPAPDDDGLEFFWFM